MAWSISLTIHVFLETTEYLLSTVQQSSFEDRKHQMPRSLFWQMILEGPVYKLRMPICMRHTRAAVAQTELAVCFYVGGLRLILTVRNFLLKKKKQQTNTSLFLIWLQLEHS